MTYKKTRKGRRSSYPFFDLRYSLGDIPMILLNRQGKIISIFNTDFIAYLVDFHIGGIQQQASLLYFQQIEVRERAMSRLLFKQH